MIYQINTQDHSYSIAILNSGSVEFFWKDQLPDNSLIVFDNGIPYSKLNIESIIQNNQDITNVFFDCAINTVDPLIALNLINDLNLSIPHYLITSNYFYYNNLSVDKKIKFFPFWMMWASNPSTSTYTVTSTLRNLITVHGFSHKPKKYKISCLNGTPNEHRKLVYLMLKNKLYFNDMVFSFGNRAPHYSLDSLLTDYEKTEFNSLPQNVSFIEQDATCGIDISINHPAFLESYVNLVTETSIDPNISMLSEKTFKPIVAGQLFVLVAAPGAIQWLRNVGIDTFDDIIDHSYDLVVDPRTRIKMVLDQIDQLVQTDLEQVYQQIKPRLLKNSRYFTSQEFRDRFLVNFN